MARLRWDKRRQTWVKVQSIKKKVNAPALKIFKPMVYDHICETPLLIESEGQLVEECLKHSVRSARVFDKTDRDYGDEYAQRLGEVR